MVKPSALRQREGRVNAHTRNRRYATEGQPLLNLRVVGGARQKEVRVSSEPKRERSRWEECSGRMTRASSREIDGGHSHRRGVSERQEMVPGAERVRCHPRTGDSQDGPQSVVAGIEAKCPKPQGHQ